jgi:hypothetical protein
VGCCTITITVVVVVVIEEEWWVDRGWVLRWTWGAALVFAARGSRSEILVVVFVVVWIKVKCD